MDLILHHHDPSPFAEKIRLALGIKGCAWQSVQVSMIMPRPEMIALTGGYRRIPVLQIGADIYCDTALITREIERRFPEPQVLPGGVNGLGIGLGRWSDGPFFDAGASLAMASPEVPEEVINDRREFFTHLDFQSFTTNTSNLYAQVAGHCQLIENELSRGTPYMTGDAPCWIDILAWFPVWMVKGYLADAPKIFARLPRLEAWAERMGAIGHGQRSELDAKDALAVAHDAEPAAAGPVDDPFSDLKAGDLVDVSPTDYGKDAVRGELVTATPEEIAVRRSHEATGEVIVHFPRLGFRVDRAS